MLIAPIEMLPTGPLSCPVLSSNLLIFYVHFFPDQILQLFHAPTTLNHASLNGESL